MSLVLEVFFSQLMKEIDYQINGDPHYFSNSKLWGLTILFDYFHDVIAKLEWANES